MVSKVEEDVRLADELLKRSPREMLTDAEWRNLSDLISSVRQSLWTCEDEWDDRLRRLWEDRALSQSDRKALSELRIRLAEARRYFNSDDMPWQSTIRPIRTRLPTGPGNPVLVESRIVPGTALGACFAEGYPAEQIAKGFSAEGYKHVSDLEQTVLTGMNGEMLFSGLRLSEFRARHLNVHRLHILPDDELKALLQDVYIPEYRWHGSCQPPRKREIESLYMDIRADPWQAVPYLKSIRRASRRKMAKEVVLAALVSDPKKFQCAIEGETVNLHLWVISLPPFDDADASHDQRHAFGWWTRRDPVRLQVRGPEGEPRTVMAKVEVSQFRLQAQADRFLFSDGSSHDAVRDLLGCEYTRELKGTAVTRVRAMRIHVSELRADLAGLITRYFRTAQRQGVEPTPAFPFGKGLSRMREEMCRLEKEMHRLETGARSLEEASLQLKAIQLARILHQAACPVDEILLISLNCLAHSSSCSRCKLRWPRPRLSFALLRAHAPSTIDVAMLPVASTRKRAKSGAIITALGAICGLGERGLPFGDGERRDVAARLALIAHLMGCTPVTICGRSRRFSDKLDAEIKFLATVADNLNGHLPPLDREEAVWGRARSDFRPHQARTGSTPAAVG